jgi:protein TonB
MRRAGIAGEVLVDFIVDSNGDVRNAYAVRSSQREFEAAAVQAVSKWKFRPGKKGGRNVNTHMQVPIVFTLNEES